MALKKSNESSVLFSIGEYLELKRRCFWRSNNIPAFNRNAGGGITMRSLPKFTPKGLPDFFVCAAGQIYGLEVKKPKELGKTYQSPAQREWQAWFEKHGGKYAVVRSIEDVQAIGL